MRAMKENFGRKYLQEKLHLMDEKTVQPVRDLALKDIWNCKGVPRSTLIIIVF